MISEFLRGAREGSPVLYWLSIVQLALVPALIAGMIFDPRLILGINPWIKPLKFFLSTIVFMSTTAWLLKDLGHPKPAQLVGWIIAVAMIVENSLIVMQSFRGVRSHFNNSSVFDTFVFFAMGSFIMIATGVMVYLFIVYWSPGKVLGPGYLWGIRLGLLIFILACLEAGLMLRIHAHTVGAIDGSPGIPLLNWSVKYGDLRIAHFVGLHALQVLPLSGWLIDLSGLQHPVASVILIAIGYGTIFGLSLLQALSGKPLFF